MAPAFWVAPLGAEAVRPARRRVIWYQGTDVEMPTQDG